MTPPFLKFLVGPSRTNLRKDGSPGGLVVEKCKFLQESNCKGLCLHQCKLPAQQFFADSLGLPVTVSPNFETQEVSELTTMRRLYAYSAALPSPT